MIPPVPSWIATGKARTAEDAAFASGAALSHLHRVLTRAELPGALLRARLALRAAEVCVTHTGRSERAPALRDATAFLEPGDQPGPAGEVYVSWRKAVERPVSVKALQRALPDLRQDQIVLWQGTTTGSPLTCAARVLQAALAEDPQARTTALVLADAALARALGWSHLVPLLATEVPRADLQATADALRLACHLAIARAAVRVTQEAADLTRRAARLRAVAPKLRARGAEAAVAQFLACDAVAPTALTSLRSDRAARRFCDRLVTLGAARELTGRDTFRLYGV
ncbi:DUF1403 family protein [uncultured Roseobacter sp.]|uniref:DUF1403 family protein n=1 Tax=uncultured Roseobacter sp. TaxID=114847 RepID=UPI0026167F41|nr:DUF1403 family protein [uncultured Roseobacter sp.]